MVNSYLTYHFFLAINLGAQHSKSMDSYGHVNNINNVVVWLPANRSQCYVSSYSPYSMWPVLLMNFYCNIIIFCHIAT